jgi:L-xylulokinase
VADGDGLFLGLDIGNTVTKAVLFDRNGKEMAACRRNGVSSSPAPGRVERDMEELWANAASAIRECIEKAGVAPEAVAALGCAGHGNGLYLLDRADAPLLAIQSLDCRADRLADELRAGGNGARLHAICLQEPWPSQTPTLLAWIRRYAPELYARTGTAFLCKDFVTFRLTGRRVSDITDMSGAGLIRLPECRYDDSLLAAYGLADARPLLPDLLWPAEIAGGVTAEAAATTGLAEGTPVVAGLFDVVANAVGSGVVDAGQASIIAGTWSINQVVARKPIADRRVFMVSAFAGDRVVAIESSATSAANLEWYVRAFMDRDGKHPDPFGACDRIVAAVTPAPDDPYFHPYLYGSRLSATMRAGFYGVAGWHGEGHMLRALFEGVAFEHRRHIEVLREAGLSFDSAALSGGGARSAVWPQMLADVLGIPVSLARCAEAGALGAAIAAGVGAGFFADLPEAVRTMTATRAQFMPDQAMAAFHDERYRTYGMLTEAMKPVWARMAGAHRGT